MQITNKLLGTLSGILAALVLATVGVWHYTPAQTQVVNDLDPVLLTDYEDLTELKFINVQTQTDSYLFGRMADGSYGEIQTDVAYVNQTQVASLFNTCSYLVLADTAVENVEDLTPYGLSPAVSVVSLLEDEGGLVLHIGDVTPDGAYRYVYVEGGNSVYIMDFYLADIFLSPKSAYLDIRFYPALSGADVLPLSQITLEKADGTGYTLLCTQASSSGNLMYFDMVSPISFVTERSNVSTLLLTPLADLEANAVVTDPEDDGVYGLDTPRYTLTLVYDGVTYAVAFGDSQDGNTFVKANDTIYTVESELLAFLEYDYVDLAGPYVFDRNITTVDTLRVSLGEETQTYTITGSGESLTAYRDGLELDMDVFIELYMQLNELPIEGIAQAVDGTVLMTMTVTYRDGSPTDMVEFIELDSRKCAVAINGQVEFFTYKSNLDLVQSRMTALG